MMILSTKNLSVGYGKHVVQQNLNLEADSGKLICLLGKNGCGKSTLLRTFASLQRQISGEIFIQGKRIESVSNAERATMLSLVLTDRIEIENMSVYELVSMGRMPYTSWNGNLKEDDRYAVERAIAAVGIQNIKYKPIAETSDGERQRAVIAKSLAQDTPLVLLDEPTSFLDLTNRIEIMLLLRSLSKEQNKTFILSTHELDLAVKMADYIWIMNNNRIDAGIPEDLLRNNIIQRSFESNNYNFETEDGHYQILQKGGDTKVVIEGEQQNTKWLRCAIKRCGIIEQQKADTTIGAFDSHFEINGKTVDTIEKVLAEIACR